MSWCHVPVCPLKSIVLLEIGEREAEVRRAPSSGLVRIQMLQSSSTINHRLRFKYGHGFSVRT